MTTMITGGTGHVGRPLLDALSGHSGVRVLVRTAADADQVRERDLQPVTGDLSEPAALGDAFAGVRRLFLLSPFVEGQQRLEHAALDAAEKAGVEHVVKLAYAGLDWPIAITAAHREIAGRLAAAPFEASLLLADVFATNLLGQADGLRGGTLTLPGPQARIAYVDPADVGQVAAALLTATTPPTGRVVVTGPEVLSNEQVAQIAGRAYTGTAAAYVPVEPAPFARSLVSAGWPAFIADAVAEMHTTIAARGPLPVSDATRVWLHRDATPLDAFFARTPAS